MMTTQTIDELLSAALPAARIRVHEAVTLGTETYEAECYLETDSLQHLTAAVRVAREHTVPVHILGLGFTPQGEDEIRGVVIKNNCRKFDMLSMKGVVAAGHTAREEAYVMAESGVPLNQLVRFTVEEGLAGLEAFLGIPGTLGDGLLSHLKTGPEGEYLAARIYSLSVLTKENEVMEVPSEPFLHPLTENMFVKKQLLPLAVVFKLKPSEKSELWKKATRAAFERNQEELTDPLKGNFNY
jgi:UDP-N-acetylenolpyruvoylglucosamine reductase